MHKSPGADHRDPITHGRLSAASVLAGAGEPGELNPWEQAEQDNDDQAGGWLLSYLDVMTLLFCFFVMLFAWQKSLNGEVALKNAALPATESQPPPPLAQPNMTQATAAPPPALPATSATALAEPAAQPATRETTPVADVMVNTASVTTSISETAEPELATLPEYLPFTGGDTPPQVYIPMPEHYPDQVPAQRMDAHASVASVSPSPAAVSTDFQALSSTPYAGPTAAAPAKALLDIPPELAKLVEVHQEGQTLHLEVSEQLLFAAAQAKLTVSGLDLLARLAIPLQNMSGRIIVEGHTDNQPIATSAYPSNWELSTARASAVTRALILKGVPASQLQAIGVADNHPRGDNNTREGRLLNRRVSLVIQLPAVH